MKSLSIICISFTPKRYQGVSLFQASLLLFSCGCILLPFNLAGKDKKGKKKKNEPRFVLFIRSDRPSRYVCFYQLLIHANIGLILMFRLKIISASFKIPIITATQLNPVAYKKDKELGIETVSESIQKVFIADFGAIIQKNRTSEQASNGDQTPKPVRQF